MIQSLARALPARQARARAPRLSRERRRLVRARPGDDHRRGRLTKTFGQGQRCRAEAAFRQDSADVPMGPSASRAVIDFILAIDGMVAASRRIEFAYIRAPHDRSSDLVRTSDESLGFNDKPIRKTCHPWATLLSRPGTFKPLWILTIALLFARRVAAAEVMAGGGDLWFQTSAFICAALQKSGPPPNDRLHPRPGNGTASWLRISPAGPPNAAPLPPLPKQII